MVSPWEGATVTTQPDLFHRMLGKMYGKQGELFPDRGVETGLSCTECGEPMVRTTSGWVTCPHGHGKLLKEEQEEPASGWFDNDSYSE